jgi:hypothetical protein
MIHAISKSEKRYFKLRCLRDSANYVELFDAIAAQHTYDEKAIKRKFASKHFVKQLHVTKNYLSALILKTLRSFHEQVSPDARLRDCLCNTEILYQKELFGLCDRELNRAERLASKYELTAGMIEVQNWKRKLRQTLHPFDYHSFNQTLEEQKKAIDTLTNIHQYWTLAISMSSQQTTKANNPNIEILRNPQNARTLEAKVLHYNMAYFADLLNNQMESAKNKLSTLVNILEQSPDRLRNEHGLYTSTINNLLSFLTFNREYEEAFKLIEKTKSIYDTWQITSENKILLKQILRTYNIELELYRQRKDIWDPIKAINKTEQFVTMSQTKMPKEYLISFWFQFASIHFMRRDFDAALHWINLLLNYGSKGTRNDLIIQAHFLNLMVHFEQQNLFVLRYFVDSTKRHLKKKQDPNPYETLILRFFTKIIRIPHSEYQEAFVELRNHLFPSGLKSLIPESDQDYIDYKGWLDWRIEKKKQE